MTASIIRLARTVRRPASLDALTGASLEVLIDAGAFDRSYLTVCDTERRVQKVVATRGAGPACVAHGEQLSWSEAVRQPVIAPGTRSCPPSAPTSRRRQT